MLLKAFQLCFWVGVLFTAASFIFGQLFDLEEFDGDIAADADATGGQGEAIISPLKPVIIAAFVTVWGGVGIICLQYLKLGIFITLAASLLCALLVSFILYRFLIVPLYKAENTGAVSQQGIIGLPAQVRLGMKGNSFGRITYVINNNTYTAPARSADGEEISKGTRVSIVDIKENVFFVTKI